jgi:hypothetical protein
MTDEEAMAMALDALELVNIEFVCDGAHHAKKDRHGLDEDCPITMRYRKAIAALKEQLAQPEQEPVAWINAEKRTFEWNGPVLWNTPTVAVLNNIPLYTHPPQRTWVGLTDEEIDEWTPEIHGVIRAIEAKLKEKNT